MAKNKITVAEFVAQQLALSDLTQREVAERLGYDRPNFITMIKQGQSKLPINKAPLLAKTLGLDPAHFLRIVLQEYSPEIWAAIEEVYESRERPLLTADEAEIIKIVREEAPDVPLDMHNDRNRELVATTIRAIASNELKERDAIRRLIDSLPRASGARRVPSTN